MFLSLRSVMRKESQTPAQSKIVRVFPCIAPITADIPGTPTRRTGFGWWRFASSRNGLLSVNRMQEAIIFLQPYIPFLEGDTDPQIL